MTQPPKNSPPGMWLAWHLMLQCDMDLGRAMIKGVQEWDSCPKDLPIPLGIYEAALDILDDLNDLALKVSP